MYGISGDAVTRYIHGDQHALEIHGILLCLRGFVAAAGIGTEPNESETGRCKRIRLGAGLSFGL